MFIRYNKEHCNISGCSNKIYKGFMCRKHYDFYTQDKHVKVINSNIEKLKKGEASPFLKFKEMLHFLHHNLFSIPMVYCEHFPLEHVFLASLNSTRKKSKIDRKRISRIIDDFNIRDNQNLPLLEYIINMKDVESMPINHIDDYIFKRKDYPSYILNTLVLFALLIILFIVESHKIDDTVILGIQGVYLSKLVEEYYLYFVLLTVFIYFGLSIPRCYNQLLLKAYNDNLFTTLRDNLDFINQIKYVKDRQTKSYKASIIGCLLAGATSCALDYISDGSSKTIYTALFLFSFLFVIYVQIFEINVIILYSPVFNSLRKKIPKINLYSTDYRGGLSIYHDFLNRTFVFNEGVVVTLCMLYKNMGSLMKFILVIVLFYRAKQGVTSFLLYIKSIYLFYKEKKLEIKRLDEVKSDISVNKILFLNKTYPSNYYRYVLIIITYILIPLIISQLSNSTCLKSITEHFLQNVYSIVYQ